MFDHVHATYPTWMMHTLRLTPHEDAETIMGHALVATFVWHEEAKAVLHVTDAMFAEATQLLPMSIDDDMVYTLERAAVLMAYYVDRRASHLDASVGEFLHRIFDQQKQRPTS